MIDRFAKFKVAIIVLSVIVVVQGLLLLNSRRSKEVVSSTASIPLEVVPAKIVPVPLEKIPEKGQIAIVIDDWGYNFRNVPLLEEIGYPLTIAILPNLPYSKRIAEKARDLGVEVILHFPLEPDANKTIGLEENTVTTKMRPAQINKILVEAIDSLGTIDGVSSHMGSKATKDKRTMRIIFKEMKKDNYYFLDSLVTPETVCEEVAEEIGIRFTKRDIFLDNIKDATYIEGQLDQLKSKAKRRGYAIGIGHDRTFTLEVLKEAMPRLEKEGYKFVLVSDLLN